MTVDLRLNEPRYPSLPNIIKAKKKTIDVKDLGSLGINVENMVKIVSLEYPVERSAGVKVASVDELVEKLENEAKVL